MEFNGLKIGDIICTYHAGFHILNEIKIRDYSSEELVLKN